MKWNHSRQGIIEGEIVEDGEVWVKIKITNKVWTHLGWASPGEVITVRKSFLQPLEEEGK